MDQVLKIIQESFKQIFSDKDHLWVFGSRVDLQRRGGDLDFYIETTETDSARALKKKMDFVSLLWDQLGEQKIDVVINITSSHLKLAIYETAKKSGVKII
jgi:hypothetical protein